MKRPADIERLTALMRANQIDYQVVEHPPLHDCQEADRLQLVRPGIRLKHLFLRDNYGRQHVLLVTRHDKAVDLKRLSRQQGGARLGFASPQRLQRCLQVAPGCVSLLALINDSEGEVQLWVDSELADAEAFQCHPLENTQTWVISRVGVVRFLQAVAHTADYLSIPAR